MMAHSNRLNEPYPMIISDLNGDDLCYGSKLFCNRSDVGISSFRYGGKVLLDGNSTDFCRISVNDGSIEAA